MDLKDAIWTRRSVRKFKEKAVPVDVLKRVLDAAVMAPSIANQQPWLFTVATGSFRDEILSVLGRSLGMIEDILGAVGASKAERQHIKEEALGFYSNLGNAPVVIVVSIPAQDSNFSRKQFLQSAAMAVQNLMLSAHGEGLATCPIALYGWIERDLKRVIKQEDRELLLALALGYPAVTPNAPPRKADVVQWLGFEGR